MPDNPIKDIRDFGFTEDPAPRSDTPADSDDQPRATGKPGKPAREAQADQILKLVHDRYDLGKSDADEPFAVRLMRDAHEEAPNVAIPLRSDTFKRALARDYYAEFGKAPSATSITDAMAVLAGEADALEPEPVYLRMAEHEGAIIIDLADTTGRCLRVDAAGWQILPRSPVPFRRTTPTAPLPAPTTADGWNLLQWIEAVFNVEEADRPLMAAWIVAALMPAVEHPILYVAGEQGSSKSTLTARLGELIDPGPARTQRPPLNEEEWAPLVAQTYLVPLDNVSGMPAWFSDALCRAVTGDASYRRVLYTTADVQVLRSRNVVILNGIELDSIRGDLASRTVRVELHTLEGHHQRRRDLDRQWSEQRPAMLAAALDALVLVLAALPNVADDERTHRLEDFRRVVAAFDQVFSTAAVDTFWEKAADLNEAVIESSTVAAMIEGLLRDGDWSGTASELLGELGKADRLPRDFPKSANSLGARLKRDAPALRAAGILVEKGHTGSGKSKKREWSIRRGHGPRQGTLAEQAAPPPDAPPDPPGVLTPDALAAEARRHGDDIPF